MKSSLKFILILLGLLAAYSYLKKPNTTQEFTLSKEANGFSMTAIEQTLSDEDYIIKQALFQCQKEIARVTKKLNEIAIKNETEQPFDNHEFIVPEISINGDVGKIKLYTSLEQDSIFHITNEMTQIGYQCQNALAIQPALFGIGLPQYKPKQFKEIIVETVYVRPTTETIATKTYDSFKDEQDLNLKRKTR